MPTLTEDDLIDMAGWPVLKRARAIFAAGSVLSASLEGHLLKGVVAQGKKQYSCGLLIRSKTDTDNLCSCPESKRDGQICAHTVAVGLATIEGLPTAACSEPTSKTTNEAAAATHWQIHVPRAFPELWEKGALPLRVAAIAGPPDAGRMPNVELTALMRSLGVDPGSESPAMLRLDHAQATSLFDAAAGLADVLLEGSGHEPERLHLSEIPCRLPVEVNYLESGEITLELRRAEAQLLRSESRIWIYQEAPPASLLPLSLPGGAPVIAELSDLFGGEILTRPLEWLTAALPIISEAFQLSSPDGLLAKLDLTPPQPTVRLGLEGSLRLVSADLTFDYPEPPVSGNSLDDRLARISGSLRNPAAEEQARSRLREAGFDEDLGLRGESEILNFYASTLPRLETDPDWTVDVGERFRHVTRDIQRLTPQLQPRGTGEDWFSFAISYATDDGHALSAGEIRRLLDAGEPATETASGKRVAIDRDALEDLQEMLRDTDPDQSGGNYRVPAAQAEYVRRTLGLEASEAPAEKAPETAIAATLRPYQAEGVDWLFARLGGGSGSAGAILADEMGLGKTLQTLTLIDATGSELPALVVCPTSLLHNWAAEAEKFAPHLDTIVLHGSASKRRSMFETASGADLILTSYGTLVRDVDQHVTQSYSIVVLDEASYIKNPDTQNARAARAIAPKASARLALTGTPIENSVRDMWSIMEFALPGYLGCRDDFRQRYEIPIGNGSQPEQSRLRRRLAPFLLRRTKRAVASDLPDKLEQVIYCELSAAQRDAYETFLRKGREQIQQLLDAQGFSKARMSILTTLLRLRQTCCHLRLIDKESEAASGKLDVLHELVQEALEGGHRVLVFSQFVNMLGIVRESLDAREIPHAYLDGSTPAEQRAAQVKTFQSGGQLPVFLISLKAGGYGLNLTAADTVIHFDPWWNPAVESQATDRAHRIGQKNPVTAYKLITTGTVEERILALQKRKRSVIATALEDEAPMMSGLSEQDVREILG